MKNVFLVLALVLCMVAVAYAAADFSGNWVLDPAKSDQQQMGRMGGGGAPGGGAPGGGAPGGGAPGGGAPGGGPGGGAAMQSAMTIKMSAAEMTITRTTAMGESETKYVLDGKENTVTTQRGETKYKAVWDGGNLTISGTTTSQRGGERPMKEVYSLSADGKELTIASTRSGQQGETVRKQVYTKK